MAYFILKSYKLDFEPLELFRILSEREYCFFLDSSLGRKGLGRYSFLGAEPFLKLNLKGEAVFTRLKEVLRRYRMPAPAAGLPFSGGAVGYLSYDLGFALEKKLKIRPKPVSEIPDSVFGVYNSAVIIDHFKKTFYIFAAGFPETGSFLAKLLAEENFKKIQEIIKSVNGRRQNRQLRLVRGGASGSPKIKSNLSKEEYLRRIKRAKQYIRAGDIYQVNFSQEFHSKTDLSAPQIYENLRRLSPSCFSAYFDSGAHQLVSSSPERFLQVQQGRVITRPMKGTRPRSRDKQRDLRLKRSLLSSPKDKAELMMIVDLERNDLGRVCDYDSIKVVSLRELEGYSTVYQTTSTIEGALHKDKDRIDLLRACFPGGSITGCPKIRAMQIIEELEPHRRGIYTGALGYLSFSGDMDFNILIRTILKKNRDIYFGSGGGIVADSRPEAEYRECLVKARAMFQAARGII